MSRFDLRNSQALWNRGRLALDSDEVLAQILDRGELDAWREIYRLAALPGEGAATLRRRILRLCQTVPLSFPHLFLAAPALWARSSSPIRRSRSRWMTSPEVLRAPAPRLIDPAAFRRPTR